MSTTLSAYYGGLGVKVLNSLPLSEATTPVIGDPDWAAAAGHRHPRLVSATVQTLDAAGTQTVMFTRSFAVEPCVHCTVYQSTGNPVDFEVTSFVQDVSLNYIGCTVKGSRALDLPTIVPISGLITLIGSLITAINNVFAALSGLKLSVPASNAKFCLTALQPSNV